jgi:hypothetical protein
MSLKMDKTQERKWLTSAKKQPKKGHGNVPTEALKNKKTKTWLNKGQKTGNGKKNKGRCISNCH